MNFVIILLPIIAVLFLAMLRLNKSRFIITKYKNVIFIIVLFLAVFSIIAVLISFYLSKDVAKLFPIALPILIIILAWTGKMNNKRNIQQNQ
jgi:hypothetical protein